MGNVMTINFTQINADFGCRQTTQWRLVQNTSRQRESGFVDYLATTLCSSATANELHTTQRKFTQVLFFCR